MTELNRLDHVTVGVSDVGRSKKFYDLALQPLGITRLYAEGDGFAGYGVHPKAFFWIGLRNTAQTGARSGDGRPVLPRSHRRRRPG
jgi:catechol 2,3-dioxygenase-like lactoylglutathione lyase family enzyme